MDFELTKDQKLLRWAVADFAKRELAGQNLGDLDRLPREVIIQMGELGFLALGLPEEYGGVEAELVELGLVVEETAKVSPTLAYLVLITHQVGFSLVAYGTEEVQREFLPDLIQGRTTGCLAVGEPGRLGQRAPFQTRAEKTEGGYLITGVKEPVSFGGRADFAICQADIGAGASAFVVPFESQGLTLTPLKDMGLNASSPARLSLAGVSIPKGHHLGQEGRGELIDSGFGMFSSLRWVLTGLISLGLAQQALGLAVAYAGDRRAFGRPISGFQAVSHKLAEDATQIEAAKWLCYRALWLRDKGRDNNKEAAMAGWWCPQVAYLTIEHALLVHGHSGYSDDLPLERMLRDSVAFEMLSGKESLLKQVVAEKLIGAKSIPSGLSSLLGGTK